MLDAQLPRLSIYLFITILLFVIRSRKYSGILILVFFFVSLDIFILTKAFLILKDFIRSAFQYKEITKQEVHKQTQNSCIIYFSIPNFHATLLKINSPWIFNFFNFFFLEYIKLIWSSLDNNIQLHFRIQYQLLIIEYCFLFILFSRPSFLYNKFYKRYRFVQVIHGLNLYQRSIVYTNFFFLKKIIIIFI